MSVYAPFAKTWNAVIDVFSDRNIPIRTIDRSSGLIATDQLTVSAEDVKWADCGSHSMSGTIAPQRAVYNVLVRGDSTQSTVKVTVGWTATVEVIRGDFRHVDCITRGVWEGELETMIRTKAQGGP
jgi:hypothetical protein